MKNYLQGSLSNVANDITELNEVLFDTLRKLQANKIDPDQAKGITSVAQTIINGAKVQSDHQKLMGNTAPIERPKLFAIQSDK